MTLISTTDVAERMGVEAWQVRRLYEDGTLPETVRVGGRRCVQQDSVPDIRAALKCRGWI